MLIVSVMTDQESPEEEPMYDYFKQYPHDVVFYEKWIKDRLPQSFVDAHAHFNLPEHVSNVSAEAIAGDWALESGLLMSIEDSDTYLQTLFPDQSVFRICLPWPLRDADTVANNQYIANLIQEHDVRGLFTVRPEYSRDSIEEAFVAGHFSGFKPYPYMASTTKGADVSIFDFMTHEQFKLANELKTAILLHLPRRGRLPDPDNIAEIHLILDRYPDIKLVVAHFGRSFCIEHFEKGLEKLGSDVQGLYFDTAAVLNPRVYDMAFNKLDHRRILFGTDFPIMLWHGKREWSDGQYHNLVREEFSWNRHPYPDQEKDYTFYVYEQIKTILDLLGSDEQSKQAIFKENALNVYDQR